MIRVERSRVDLKKNRIAAFQAGCEGRRCAGTSCACSITLAARAAMSSGGHSERTQNCWP